MASICMPGPVREKGKFLRKKLDQRNYPLYGRVGSTMRTCSLHWLDLNYFNVQVHKFETGDA